MLSSLNVKLATAGLSIAITYFSAGGIITALQDEHNFLILSKALSSGFITPLQVYLFCSTI